MTFQEFKASEPLRLELSKLFENPTLRMAINLASKKGVSEALASNGTAESRLGRVQEADEFVTRLYSLTNRPVDLNVDNDFEQPEP